MCGIVGVVCKNKIGLSKQNQKMFEQLLVIDSLRGTDSTGVFGVERKKGEEVFLHKQVGHGANFVTSDGWDVMDSYIFSDMKCLVGHNRAATRGVVSDENAHPFHQGPIVLLHNGTLTAWQHLLPKTEHKISVDSEAIAYALSEADSWKEVLPKIEGAFAMVWYDLRDKTLRIATNGERPLWYAMSVSGDLYFASEYEMLNLVAARNKEALYADDKELMFFPHTKNTVIEIPYNFDGDFRNLKHIPFEKEKKVFTTGVSTKVNTHGKTKTQNKTPNSIICAENKVIWEPYDITPHEQVEQLYVVEGFAQLDGTWLTVVCTGTANAISHIEIGESYESKIRQGDIRVGKNMHDAIVHVTPKNTKALDKTTVISKNGVIVDKERWTHIAHSFRECCYCGNLVTVDDFAKSHVVMNGAFPSIVVCEQCIDEHNKQVI